MTKATKEQNKIFELSKIIPAGNQQVNKNTYITILFNSDEMTAYPFIVQVWENNSVIQALYEKELFEAVTAQSELIDKYACYN